jgi:hypothetical protein
MNRQITDHSNSGFNHSRTLSRMNSQTGVSPKKRFPLKRLNRIYGNNLLFLDSIQMERNPNPRVITFGMLKARNCRMEDGSLDRSRRVSWVDLMALCMLSPFYLFVYKLMGSTVGQRYEFEPKIWDPQAATDTIQATFSSPMGSLPHWLHWEDGQRLVGVPDAPMPGFTVFVIADVSPFSHTRTVADDQFVDSDKVQHTLDMSYTLHAVAPMAPAVVYHQPQHQMYGTGYPQMVMPPMSQMSHHPQPMYVLPTSRCDKADEKDVLNASSGPVHAIFPSPSSSPTTKPKPKPTQSTTS